MIDLLLVRHAPTAWNRAGRIQGRTDIPLDDAGIAQARRWRLPAAFGDACLLASPLLRARQTAAILATARSVETEPRLIEMDWGRWAGRTLSAARADHPAAAARNEARGLDFRPPDGESPREVAARVAELLAELAATGRATVAVTHKGVVRAALALATGWEMRTKPPLRIGAAAGLWLEVGPAGTPTVARAVLLAPLPVGLPA